MFTEEEMKDIIIENIVDNEVLFKPYEVNEDYLLPNSTDNYISKTHIARLINLLIDKIDISDIIKTYKGGGTTSYNPRMLLKAWILGFIYRIYTSRKLEIAINENLPFIWISGGQTPDFRTLNNFRLRLKGEIKEIFKQIVEIGIKLGIINGQDVFIDHTKMEANGNKYKITWRKNVERQLGKIENELEDLFEYIDKVNSDEDKKYGNMKIKEKELKTLDPEKIVEMINKLNEEIKKNRKEKKDTEDLKEMKGNLKRICELHERKVDYEIKERILGNRNSFSNTDCDATAMLQKDKLNIKPAYNEGIAVQNGFILNYEISQNAGDNVSFKDVVNGAVDNIGVKPENVSADGAYGTEENSEYLEENDINNYMKFQTFQNEKSRKWHRTKVRKEDMHYDVTGDFYICPNNAKLFFLEEREITQKSGFKGSFRIYEAEHGKCKDCRFKKYCTDGQNRTIHMNENYEKHKDKMRENLESEKGFELRKRRGNEAESPFGDRKYNQKNYRFVLRSLEKVEIESGMYWMGHNIRKIYKYLLNNWLNNLNVGSLRQLCEI